MRLDAWTALVSVSSLQLRHLLIFVVRASLFAGAGGYGQQKTKGGGSCSSSGLSSCNCSAWDVH